MGQHHCHALGCKAACPPRWLMCRKHWAMVPPNMQAEVYRTVGLRDRGGIDETWAPWWRAQAHAIAHVAFQECPDVERRDRWLAKELAAADELEAMADRCTPVATDTKPAADPDRT